MTTSESSTTNNVELDIFDNEFHTDHFFIALPELDASKISNLGIDITKNKIVTAWTGRIEDLSYITSIYLFNNQTLKLESAMSYNEYVLIASNDICTAFLSETNEIIIWDLNSYKVTVTPVPFTIDLFSTQLHLGQNVLVVSKTIKSCERIFFIYKISRENDSVKLDFDKVEIVNLPDYVRKTNCAYPKCLVENNESGVNILICVDRTDQDIAMILICKMTFSLSSADSSVHVNRHDCLLFEAQHPQLYSLLLPLPFDYFVFDDFVVFANETMREIQAWSMEEKQLAHRFPYPHGGAHWSERDGWMNLTIVNGRLFEHPRKGNYLVWWHVERDYAEKWRNDLKAGVIRCTEGKISHFSNYVSTNYSGAAFTSNESCIVRYKATSPGNQIRDNPDLTQACLMVDLLSVSNGE